MPPYYHHYSSQRPFSRRERCPFWLILLLYNLLQIGSVNPGLAQSVVSVVRIDSMPTEGLQLKQGWRFHAGDLPNGADPALNDSRWDTLNPVRDIRQLPALTNAPVSWLRLHLTIDPKLPPLQTFFFMSVASEVYFDGRLLYRFGTVSNRPASVVANNPYAAYPVPYVPGKTHLLALRMAPQPGIDYQKIYLGMLPSPARLTLYLATAIPAVHPYNVASVYVDSAKIGMAAILFILHLGLFLAYRRQRANLVIALMYLLLMLTHVLRAGVDLTHELALRDILPIGPLLYPFVIGLMFLTFYELFGMPKNGWLWLVLIAIALTHIQVPPEYRWINQIGGHYQTVELIRIIVVSIRRRLFGARIVAVGIFGHMALSLFVTILVSTETPVIGNEWLYELGYGLMFLCIPLALSLRLALENGWVNRQLGVKLAEVEELSVRNQVQQAEKQRILTQQNEELEQQVAERTRELRQHADHLDQINRDRSRFVTNLTHEFRTPLALILSPVSKLLESPNLPDATQASLHTVDRNARHLLNQVNQLLDIARLEDGQMNLNPQPVQLGQQTAQLVDLFQSPAQAKSITLTFARESEDSPCLMDTDKWGKIVYNLLANAIKFTPEGGIVDCELGRSAVAVVDFGLVGASSNSGVSNQSEIRNRNGGPPQFAILKVTDSGIGIAPEKLPYIFDRFYQADDRIGGPRVTRSYEGTGVGLALVRELTDLMGGNVTVESQPGVGSTFTVTLPWQPAPPDATSETRLLPIRPIGGPLPTPAAPAELPDDDPADKESDASRELVLVVEDNDELRGFMVDELAARYSVLTATNGQAGWEAVQQHLPDLVISDVMMPQMDGLQLTRLIKTTPATDHIAVVLLTARSTPESLLEGLEHGADDYIVKPFDLTELRFRLANLVARQHKLQAYYRQQTERPNGHEPALLPALSDPFLTRVYDLLESNLDNRQVDVGWLADQLAMDRKTLYRKLQSKLKLAPNALIRAYRLRRAGEMLRAGKTVTDTTYSVGFESLTYFGYCFKEQYGVTPSEFAGDNSLNSN